MQFGFVGDDLRLVETSTGGAMPAIVQECFLPY
jgi:hypothetical protein